MNFYVIFESASQESHINRKTLNKNLKKKFPDDIQSEIPNILTDSEGALK
jgi:predicted RNA-binding protein YlxR (DUF448 family)